jgi:hypothetical protein
MLARYLPLLVLWACASTPPASSLAQPELARQAQPYASQLRAVGITHLEATAGGAMVRLETLSGPVYIPYPKDVPAIAFVLDVDPDGLHAFAAGFDKARDAAVLDAVLPRAIRATATNNVQVWVHNNPWN